ncbi:uncharacterized protein MELLADRAFT_114569 [Melampsora larici-populina 98AG31]|uniref:Uncharacterized protein n=1 Tax=Melampsora larici-populina (strain 98AG31 / pathotype 3-4-7) TaxID=747676 RepID=F4SDZ7_MELLP|nr:uncharacterized protein MELLADRAFT_114569 [Melampsora larici-populina 98AG31]EGF97130.1 hypothetical protein MELLADRAFT_114569 [Melampsora larici-populina 98AG31]
MRAKDRILGGHPSLFFLATTEYIFANSFSMSEHTEHFEDAQSTLVVGASEPLLYPSNELTGDTTLDAVFGSIETLKPNPDVQTGLDEDAVHALEREANRVRTSAFLRDQAIADGTVTAEEAESMEFGYYYPTEEDIDHIALEELGSRYGSSPGSQCSFQILYRARQQRERELKYRVNVRIREEVNREMARSQEVSRQSCESHKQEMEKKCGKDSGKDCGKETSANMETGP